MIDVFKNGAEGTLTAGIAAGATACTVGSGEGAKFNNTTTESAFYFAIWNSTDYTNPTDDPFFEMCRCTVRATDAFSTIVRAQEGTADVNHNLSGKTYKVAQVFTRETLRRLAAGLGIYGIESGVADTYVVSLGAYVTALEAGIRVCFKPANTNTSASTVAVAGTAATAIKRPNGVDGLVAGDLKAGRVHHLVYDGTNWILEDPVYSSLIVTAVNQQAANTNGGAVTTGAWTAAVLNTLEQNDGSIASIASNRVTLPAGEYIIRDCVLCFAETTNTKIKLYNHTASADIQIGQTGKAQAANINTSISIPHKRFTLAVSSALELRYYCSSNPGVWGQGVAYNTGDAERYSFISFEKIG